MEDPGIIPLSKLPMAEIAAYLELNPPGLPYNSLVGLPSKGNVGIALLDEFIAPAGGASGFGVFLHGKLAGSSYAHLLIDVAARVTGASDQPVYMQFNTDTSPFSTNYDWQTTNPTSSNGQAFPGDAHIAIGTILKAASPYPSPVQILIPDFQNASDGKGVHIVSGSYGHVEIIGGGWHLAQAIDQVEFQSAVGCNIAAGSRFTFYALGAL